MNNRCLTSWYQQYVEYPIYENAKSQWSVDYFKTEWCYVVFNHDNGTFKIGVSNNLNQRIRQLITQSGCSISVVFAIELEVGYDEPSEVLEKALHKYFEDKRSIGEWYKLNIRDLIKIKNLFWEHIEGSDIQDNFKELFLKV